LDLDPHLSDLIDSSDRRILLAIMDGVGGLPGPEGLTELELASTPNLDALADSSICGLSVPIAPGITPGSGPGHIAVFGYDPFKYQIGRGVLSALGIAFPLQRSDVAARMNFATIDGSGAVTDRRAGRISTELCTRLCEKLESGISLPGAELFVRPEKEHRAALIIRGEKLSGLLTDTDPQKIGVAPNAAEALAPEAEATAALVGSFLEQAFELLADESPANALLTRGFAMYDPLPDFQERYGLRAAAVAGYPMYRGVARLVGMDVLDCGETIESEIKTVREDAGDYDFVFVHFKKTDSAGEDGDYKAKVKAIEAADAAIGELQGCGFSVIVVTGDHSTPCALKAHSWHPVPLLINSEFSGVDGVKHFTEKECATGGLGHVYAKHIMLLALANALRIKKFGA
jgi:2,3-bisphosphoglycerate-independent phosphoglycerate mutase